MYTTRIKRTLDITFALTILIITLPVSLVIALLIKLESRGPVVFTQKRFGQYKQPFTIYKFRTMYTHAPNSHPTNNLINAKSYITKTGKVLRKLSLDELPQLINVLRGEMSIVGPRPVILQETDLIAEREKYSANNCKPGITGWAQVNGRDELRLKKKAKMDGKYAENLSFAMDAKCIALTLWAVLSIKGHREGAADTTDQFAVEGGES